MTNDRDWCEGCKAIRANVDICTGLCAPCIKRQAEEHQALMDAEQSGAKQYCASERSVK